MAQVLERDRLQRRHHRDASIVDEAVEAGWADLVPNALGRAGDLLGVGHVEDEGHEARRGRLSQVLPVLLAPHAGEHPPALAVHAQGAGATDTGRSSCHQD